MNLLSSNHDAPCRRIHVMLPVDAPDLPGKRHVRRETEGAETQS